MTTNAPPPMLTFTFSEDHVLCLAAAIYYGGHVQRVLDYLERPRRAAPSDDMEQFLGSAALVLFWATAMRRHPRLRQPNPEAEHGEALKALARVEPYRPVLEALFCRY